jgi:hypothetical protein
MLNYLAFPAFEMSKIIFGTTTTKQITDRKKVKYNCIFIVIYRQHIIMVTCFGRVVFIRHFFFTKIRTKGINIQFIGCSAETRYRNM